MLFIQAFKKTVDITATIYSIAFFTKGQINA